MATPTQFRRRGRWSLVLGTLIAAVALAAVAYADNLQADLDTNTGGLDKTVNLGTLPASTPQSQDVFLYVQEQPGATNNPTYPFVVTGSKGGASTFPGAIAFSDVTISGADTGNGETGQVTWTTPAAQTTAQDYSIIVTFEADTDINESPSTVTITFSIAAAPSNQAPTASAGGPYTVGEGGSITLNGSGTDPDGDTLIFSWDLDNNGTFETPGQSATFSAASLDGPTSRTVVVRACDPALACDIDSVGISITNVPPSVSITGAPTTSPEGTAIGLGSIVTDPGVGDTFSYAWSVTKDGNPFGSGGLGSSFTFAPDDNGTYVVSLTVTDDDGGQGSDTKSVAVANVAPSITSASFGAAASCSVGGADNVNLTVSFTDPGTDDTWSVDVDWDNDGDYDQHVGSYTSGTEIGHLYATAGSHTARVKITDDDGGVSGEAAATAIVNYNLSALQSPINNTGHGDNPSMFKYGSTVPVKVEITDCDGSHPSGLDVRVYAAKLSGNPPTVGDAADAVATQPDSGNVMRFSNPLYVFNWSTKSIADSSSTVRITVKIISTGQTEYADIGLKSK